MRSFFGLTIAISWAVLFQASFANAQESSVKKVGFEILQIKSLNEVVAWASKDISRKEFDAIKLPLGWFKNQPREVECDSAKFLNSPGMDRGEMHRAEHFGHQWLHVATVQLMDLKILDSKGKLRGSTVVKDHWVTFEKGSLLVFLVSPEGKLFPRITRDANRTQEHPMVPEGWHLVEHKLDRRVEFRLTGKTTVIRADNEDSFQGPVEFADFKNLELANADPFLKNKGSKEWNVGSDDKNGPSYGTPNAKQWMELRKVAMDEDRDFLMVNLIKYRKFAKYADGRKTDLTGRQANSLYSPVGFLARIGASIRYMGQVAEQLDNKSTPSWDEVAVVNYPSRAKFFEMVDDSEFRKRTVHKDAGLEFSQIIVTEPVPWALPNTKRIADQADAFTLVELLKYRDDVPEHPDSDERFSGKLALDACDAATEQIERRVGARRVLRSFVKGTLVGDGRNWDEFRMLHFPSESAFESYRDAVRKMPNFRKERESAVEDYYLLKVKTAPLAKRIAASLATSFFGRLQANAAQDPASSLSPTPSNQSTNDGLANSSSQNFSGTWRLVDDATQASQRSTSIENAIAGFGRFKRGRAREMLTQKTTPPAKLTIVDSGAEIKIARDGQEFTVPTNGQAVSIKSPEGSATLRAGRRDGKLVVETKSTNATNTTTFELSSDGKTMTRQVQLKASALSKAIQFNSSFVR